MRGVGKGGVGAVMGALCALAGLGAVWAQAPSPSAPPPLSAYGNLPDMQMMEMAPDGETLAVLTRVGGKAMMVVLDRQNNVISRVGADSIRTRRLSFLSDQTILLQASEATDVSGLFRNEFEYSAAFLIDRNTSKVSTLLDRSNRVYPYQSGIGRVIGVSPDGKTAYVPAYSQVPQGLEVNARNAGAPIRPYSLFAVDTASGEGKIDEKGTEDTIDWFVGQDGTVKLRESYDPKAKIYRVSSYASGKPVDVVTRKDVVIQNEFVMGLTPDETGFVFYEGDGETTGRYVQLAMTDGSDRGEVFADIEGSLSDLIITNNRHVLGAEVAGLRPTYVFFDKALEKDVKALQAAFPDAAVRLDSWSADLQNFLVHVSGTGMPGGFLRFNRKTLEAELVAFEYEGVPLEAVAPVEAFTYTARDGLEIEAVLTGRPKAGEAPKPLILLPHGGPASHDVIGFDWMAQALASRGYVVLQPNFRGSTGYGLEFQNAGRGEWGAAMQDDLTDGVEAVVEAGIAKAGEACIVGASYGGYAALMGGATTPELFRCVVAIAPVSDPKALLREVREERGADSQASRYWRQQLGVKSLSDDVLKDIAPVRLAEGFDDPVLLLHGEKDTVVDFSHARRMADALKRAGKSVQLVKLKDEDHWLSLGPTRLQTLEAIDAFLKAHLPVR